MKSMLLDRGIIFPSIAKDLTGEQMVAKIKENKR